MNNVEKSYFSDLIDQFVEHKRDLGYPYQSSARILKQFDRMIYQYFPTADKLTKEICEHWIRQKPGEHPNGLMRRITPVRQFAKYLNGTGIPAYIIPNNIPGRQVKYEAHIYTEQELKSFFQAIDRCPKSPFSPVRHLVIPVLFRMLFCCGLRSSEARTLLCEDVDLSDGRITIRESKGWKCRIIYVSSDLLSVLMRYDSAVGKLLPNRVPFFPNQKGKIYNRSTINVWFHEFWDPLPEAKTYVGNPPRVHDFRHSFCVYCLNQWVREGKDISALYPYLSEYLGHANFADTDYYLSLVPSFYPDMYRLMSSVNEEILPEVLEDE